MKKIGKLLTVILSLVMTASVTACVGVGREEVGGTTEINKAMSQLYVSNFEGGFGRVWLDNAAKRFEEMYADESFEDGKKGVQVIIDSSIQGKTGTTLLSGLSNDTNDVYFTEDVFYYDLIAQNGAADITDIVATKDLSEWGEDGITIESKMDSTVMDFYKTSDGKYYSLPHYEAYYGIIYDADLFRKRGLYFLKGGTPGEYSDFVQQNNADHINGIFSGTYRYTTPIIDPDINEVTQERSTGPDGIYGTYDDGLPATYEEFFVLCDKMKDMGIIPFTWTGRFTDYSTSSLYQLWADYEGRDQFLLNFNFGGTDGVARYATDLIDHFDSAYPNDSSKATLMSPVEITDDNVYMLQRQLGKYYATEFARKIATTDGYASDLSYSQSESHITSEGTYLLSRLEPTKTPIAFTFNGVWWENEADENGYFTQYAKYGETRMSRQFGMLPMPKVNNSLIGTKRTIASDLNRSQAFINKRLENNPVRLNLAKKFLQFLHTDDELQNFTVASSTNKPFNYSISQQKMVSMSPFGCDIAEMRNNDKIDMVYTLSAHPTFIKNFDKLYRTRIDWANNTYSRNIIYEFHNNGSLTVNDFFNALISSKDEHWLTK